MNELERNLQTVRGRIEKARFQAGIGYPVHLIAVSKTFPADDIRALCAAGQRDFGENYIREFSEKAQVLTDLPVVWHVIGDVQSNKCKAVAEQAHWVHTVSREKTARRLSALRPEHLPPLNICIEINITGEAGKHGIPADEETLAILAREICALPKLKLRGLMCVAEENAPEDVLKEQFGRMRLLAQFLQQQGMDTDTLSMGMSADLETAVACGATHVRVGRALFGRRERKSAAAAV